MNIRLWCNIVFTCMIGRSYARIHVCSNTYNLQTSKANIGTNEKVSLKEAVECNKPMHDNACNWDKDREGLNRILKCGPLNYAKHKDIRSKCLKESHVFTETREVRDILGEYTQPLAKQANDTTHTLGSKLDTFHDVEDVNNEFLYVISDKASNLLNHNEKSARPYAQSAILDIESDKNNQAEAAKSRIEAKSNEIHTPYLSNVPERKKLYKDVCESDDVNIITKKSLTANNLPLSQYRLKNDPSVTQYSRNDCDTEALISNVSAEAREPKPALGKKSKLTGFFTKSLACVKNLIRQTKSFFNKIRQVLIKEEESPKPRVENRLLRVSTSDGCIKYGKRSIVSFATSLEEALFRLHNLFYHHNCLYDLTINEDEKIRDLKICEHHKMLCLDPEVNSRAILHEIADLLKQLGKEKNKSGGLYSRYICGIKISENNYINKQKFKDLFFDEPIGLENVPNNSCFFNTFAQVLLNMNDFVKVIWKKYVKKKSIGSEKSKICDITAKFLLRMHKIFDARKKNCKLIQKYHPNKYYYNDLLDFLNSNLSGDDFAYVKDQQNDSSELLMSFINNLPKEDIDLNKKFCGNVNPTGGNAKTTNRMVCICQMYIPLDETTIPVYNNLVDFVYDAIADQVNDKTIKIDVCLPKYLRFTAPKPQRLQNYPKILQRDSLSIMQSFSIENNGKKYVYVFNSAICFYALDLNVYNGIAHYKAIVYKNGRYYECDDSRVTQKSEVDALEAVRLNGTTLIYELTSTHTINNDAKL